MLRRLIGPDAVSANALAQEVGVGQTLLSRWLRESRTVEPMTSSKKKRWTGAEKLRVLLEARGLSETDLGALLRREGLHETDLMAWQAAAEAALTEVLTDQAYEKLSSSNRTLLDGCQKIIDTYELPAYTEGLGAKGCVIFSAERLYEYRDYLTKVDDELSRLAWLYHMNHGIFMTPGTEEEWTLSVAHSDEDLQRYLDAFEAFAADVTGG